jgi:primosomal protein N' (replication factor Y)
MAIVRVALPVNTHQLFDYWLPEGPAVEAGTVLVVKLARRRLVGVAMDIVETSKLSPEMLQPVEEVLSDVPRLPDDLREVGRFVAAYYQQPIGQCLAQMLPPLTQSRQRAPLAARHRLSAAGHTALAAKPPSSVRGALVDALSASRGASTDDIRRLGTYAWRTFSAWRRTGLVEAVPDIAAAPLAIASLNAEQRSAVDAALLKPSAYATSLLQGVTGSGKTEVYLEAAARTIQAGRQALFLVPEINLTPQLEQRIASALPQASMGVMHSRLADTVRRRQWSMAARGELQLVLGTRLAVFAPMPNLGLIVVDEEHDASFKQQDGVRYHARDVAIYRARLRSVPVILGSATPSLESYAQAIRGRYRWIRLRERATARKSLPEVHLVPNRAADNVEGISAPLQRAISERLERREQTLLFINRRGYAPSLLCAACGWKAMCPRCSARLVLHRHTRTLRCHHCGDTSAIPSACPECGNIDLLPLGFGTQRLEHALSVLHPAARVLRIDRDSTAGKGSFEAMRDAIAGGQADILVGTQMLAKGHDFPQLKLVGVLGADNALYSAEFRATERLSRFQHVGGRARRGKRRGEVWGQTAFPYHPRYQALVTHDYDSYARSLLAERKALSLPPLAHLTLLGGEAKSSGDLMRFLGAAADRGRVLTAERSLACSVYPPVPAALPRRAGLERAQVLVQSDDRREMQEFLPAWRAEIERLSERRVRWTLDVDPLGFA